MNPLNMSSLIVRLQIALLVSGLLGLPSASAATFSVKSFDKQSPEKLGASIRAVLSSNGYTILRDDQPIFEIWLRTRIPLKKSFDAPEHALNALAQTSLIGAIAVLSDARDYRDDEIYAGIYTLRFDLRPEDGNHLGTSEHLFFAVLVEAKNDRDLAKITHSRQLSKASSKSSPNDHPVIFSLFPASSKEVKIPSIHEPASGHQAIRLSISGVHPDRDDAMPIPFDLVIEGMADF